MANIRDIGVDVQAPPKEGKPGDPTDPFYGTLSVRGQIIVGQVVNTKMQGSCLVQREYFRYMPKYQRFEKRTGKYTAHVPASLDVNVGDIVRIMECRPLSKNKHFVVIESQSGELRITGMEAEAEPAVAEATEPAEGAEEGGAEE